MAKHEICSIKNLLDKRKGGSYARQKGDLDTRDAGGIVLAFDDGIRNIQFMGGGRVTYPEGRKPEFDAAMQQLARHFSATTGQEITVGAVTHQLHWAINKRDNLAPERLRNFILNKAASLEAVFLTYQNLNI